MEFADFNTLVGNTKQQIADDTKKINTGINLLLLGTVIGVVATPVGLSVLGVTAAVYGALNIGLGSRLRKLSLVVGKDNNNTVIEMYGTKAEQEASAALNAKEDDTQKVQRKHSQYAVAGAVVFSALSVAFAPVGAVCLITAASIAIASQFDLKNSRIETVRMERERLARKVMARRVHPGFDPVVSTGVAKPTV